MMDYEMMDDCDKCELESFMLIEQLINDIQHLASEVVRLRHLLSRHLPKHVGETIRGELLSDLHGSYYGYAAYMNFVSTYCRGNDPMESENFINHMIKLSKGEDSSEFRPLTF